MKSAHLNLLLVEDNEDHAMLIKTALDESAITLSHVGTAELALTRLQDRSSDIHLLLADVKLPNGSGIDLLKWVKADRQLALLPVIMLSTSANPIDIAASYSAGASGYITKPVGLGPMKDKLKHFIRYWLEVCVVPNGN
ncbi:response regulator [Simiduia curdlanivorans]|uniref:Response regulator n=1 Tax=Simiduia curdlanivorans TaxID=1492769 RepID=A0ABV8V5S4_9GAMM|nr:response regulator [Simiduia curdlanivorans]MDN3638617.1 response regulator [Simiduia curdlanivorans]